MEMILRFEFDNASFFPEGYIGTRSVKLINPSVIPATGDAVHIRMEEFFDNSDLLSNFEKQSEGQVYYAERLSDGTNFDFGAMVTRDISSSSK